MKHSKVLNYSVEQLYNLAVDIDSYSKFVPFCTSSTVVHKEAGKIVADLTVQFKAFAYSYRSEVLHSMSCDGAEISTNALPNTIFKHLRHNWIFRKVEDGTIVETTLDCALKSALLSGVLDVLLTSTERKMIDAFERRAEELYATEG